MTMQSLRRRYLSKPMLSLMQRLLPPLSDTERQALNAGGVWWDAQILSGRPDWQEFLGLGPPTLTEEERAFVDGPVAELCAMVDDWEITFERRDLPDDIWRYLKEHRFFGMIIPKEHGGLGFSAAAHSEVVMRLGTRSTTVAITVMVPNSLGPGELLLAHGTEDQKAHYLPRLADGREIPCFGLTSPEAGSDAASMVDSGVVCYREHDGERVLGIRANWHKRYITLGPVATLLGLAFKLYDPDHLLGEEEELGITVALVPTDTPGVEIGARHYPCMQAFQNGPNWGHDVFIPMDWVIGGQEKIGHGWQMLMSALAAGRSISLPALSTGAAKLCARTTSAYARIREQFGVPIGAFEGIQARLAKIAVAAYGLDAARTTTTLALDHGKVPAVVSAILKAHATYRMREVVDHAMDVHGGKTIIDGPLNYLGNVHRAVPVAITVEGANILTRNLIIFGQGAIRCHPFLLDEMAAAEKDDLDGFDALLARHLKFTAATVGRALGHSLTGGRFAAAPRTDSFAARYYRQISRYSAALTLVTEFSLLSLGGTLKRREMISARLGDVLSELYLSSCVLKRYEDDGRPEADRPLLEWSILASLHRVELAFDAVLRNFPKRPLAWLMRALVMPLGRVRKPPNDALSKRCADLLMQPSATRERLTEGVYLGQDDEGIALVERAFALVEAAEPLKQRLRKDRKSISDALGDGTLSDTDAQALEAADAAVAAAIRVDWFDPEVLSPRPAIGTTRAN